METRVSVVSIIVSDRSVSSQINELLHQYAEYVIGRMGIPHAKKGVSVICVVLDAPQNVTSTLSGKLGMIPGVQTKTVTSK